MDLRMSDSAMDDLNWLVMRGHTVIIKPVSIDPESQTPIYILIRVEKNHKLVTQVSHASINIGLNDVVAFVKKSRRTG